MRLRFWRRPPAPTLAMTVEHAADELAWTLAEARDLIRAVPSLGAPDEVHAAFAERVARFQARKAAMLAYFRTAGRADAERPA